MNSEIEAKHLNLFFEEEFIDHIFESLTQDMKDGLKRGKGKNGRCFVGCGAFHNARLINGVACNVWIQWDAVHVGSGYWDTYIRRVFVYDEIPDEVLDNYNEMSKWIEECKAKEQQNQ